jgi:hypothetical protein
MLVIGAATGGDVGPQATSWVPGMLPIASLYVVLLTGYALGGRALRTSTTRAADAPAARLPLPASV